MFWLAYAIITALCLVGLNRSDNRNFGSYRFLWRKYESCKGPKQGECGEVEIRNTQNMSDVIFFMDYPKDCPLTKIRVTIGSMQKNNYTKKLWNYALEKPCQHFVFGPILVNSFNATGSCKIKKGQYTVHINMNEIFSTFLGTNFFYGIYAFKIMALNNANNFVCVYTIVETKKL